MTTPLRTFKSPQDHADSCAIWVEADDVTGRVFPVGECDCRSATPAEIRVMVKRAFHRIDRRRRRDLPRDAA